MRTRRAAQIEIPSTTEKMGAAGVEPNPRFGETAPLDGAGDNFSRPEVNARSHGVRKNSLHQSFELCVRPIPAALRVHE